MNKTKATGKKSLSAGVALNIIASFALRGIGIITAPITTRLLGESDYGAMSIFSTWVAIATIVFGVQTYGTFTNAKYKYNAKEYHRYCWNALLISAAGHLIGFGLILPWMDTISSLIGLSPLLIILLIVQSFFQSCTDKLCSYLLIENEATKNFILSSLISVGSFGLSVFFVTSGFFSDAPYMGYIVGHLSVIVISGLLSIAWFIHKGGCGLRKDFVKYCLGLSFPLVFHGLSGIILGQSDRIMLERMSGLAAAGVYSLTYSFASVVNTIWSAINAIWVPFYFRYLKEENYDEMKRHMLNFDILYITIIAGFLLLYPEVFHIMDSRYWNQLDIIPVLVLGHFFNHLYGYPANYEFYKEKSIHIAVGTMGSAVINIILNLLLIPRYQAMGAAFATMLSSFICFVFHAVMARKVIKGYPISVRYDFMRILPMAGILLIVYFFREMILIRWILAVLLGIWLVIRMVKKKEII